MSDHIVKLIPSDPFYKPSDLALGAAEAFLEGHISCGSIRVIVNDTPVFVDCGSNLSKISCPECGAELDIGWWQGAMDKAYESAFTALDAVLPCCGASVSLNELCYCFPCGFACASIEIYNSEQPVEDETMASLQQIVGTELRVIYAHL